MGSRSRTIGIYLYPDVEALDFAGPFEVFTTANRLFKRNISLDDPPFQVFSVAESASQVLVRAGIRVEPDFTIGDHPKIELLLVPGGVVSEELKKPHVLDWIRQCASQAEVTASICTGAFLLAKSGVIRTGKVTTHWEDQADLAEMFPSLQVVSDRRWVEEGSVFTSAGIAAGMDLALHLVGKFCGESLAVKTARQMEYPWGASL